MSSTKAGVAEKLQNEAFRKMKPEERVAAAFAFSELVRRVAESGIRVQRPELSSEEVKRELLRRISINNPHGRTS